MLKLIVWIIVYQERQANMTTQLSEMTIPFGKYKGEDITKLFEDRKYLKWCQDQPWFKEKYSNIYNIVVNQTIVQSSVGDKTPEHNKIQNLFLDVDLCVKLLNVSGTELKKDKDGRFYRHEYCVCNECVLCETHKKLHDRRYSQTIIGEEEYTKVNKCGECVQCSRCKITERKGYRNIKVEFEGDFNWDLIVNSDNYRTLIEIKPTLGDDYPNVLRKMKHQIKLFTKAKKCNVYVRGSILLLNNFDSINTSKENLKKIFSQSDIRVIFLDELDIHMNKYISIEDENKLLKKYLASLNIDYKQILNESN